MGTARALVIVPPSLEDLTHGSDVIVLGTVESVVPILTETGRIRRRVKIRVGQALLGAHPNERIELDEPGGEFGDRLDVVAAAPTYEPQEKVLLFARRGETSFLQTTQLTLGKFRVVESPSGGWLARRTLPPDTWQILPGTGSSRWGDGPVEDLVAAIRSTLSDPLTSPPRPANPAAAEGREEGFRSSGTAAAIETGALPYTLGRPVGRLFEPDVGETVSYRIDARGDAILGLEGSLRALAAALEVWSQPPSTSLRLLPGPLREDLALPCPAPPGEALRLRFRDPDREIPAPVNCRGILALATYQSIATETKRVAGQTFGRILCGSVTFADGWEGCSVWNECNVAEIAAHEIGHTIGFGHSSERDPEPDARLRDAAMYFRAHFDGRCAELRDDDLDALSFVYPASVPPSILTRDPLPAAVPGQSYDLPLAATGGLGALNWRVERSDYCGLEVRPEGRLQGVVAGCLCRARPDEPPRRPEILLRLTDARGDQHTRPFFLPFSDREAQLAPTCTPTPTASPSPRATATLSPLPSPSATASLAPSASPSPTDTPLPSPIPSTTPSPTPSLPPTTCAGDCDGSGAVTIDELVRMVGLALTGGTEGCPAGDANADGTVTVNEIILAVNHALYGCGATNSATRNLVAVPPHRAKGGGDGPEQQPRVRGTGQRPGQGTIFALNPVSVLRVWVS